ncbi:protein kinase domain-containing protein [Rubrivirga sp. IMCC45206]|uniref:protein kinase domain-containing protein n=1 Tax=Rubrivirga sp. IMCC45206 TaxID=3391614 RepID=UPI00398FCAA9
MSAFHPPTSPPPLVGSDVGPYRVVERVGAGGMGVVYRATDTRLGREVALKVLAPGLVADESARARLLQEARAVAALDHVHLAAIFDVGETHGQPYLAMAFYDGETLRERLDRGPLAAAEAAGLGAQIARGLAAAHHAGVVHRDLKPANVMLLPRGGPGGGPCVKVLDFGIAHLDGGELTQDGESLGTALYMSPEQLRGERADARSDVWALGVVLFETVTGRRPFDGAYAAARAYAVLHEPTPPLGDLPAGLVDIVAACLEKDPADRPASMEAVAEALDALGRDKPPPPPTGATPRATPEPAHRASRARRIPRMAMLAGVVLVAVLAAVALWPEAAVAEPHRLAVLPFRAVGAEAGMLSEGLVETVTGKLGQVGPVSDRVRIVPASEVPAGLTPTQARDQLGATLVVEGTVQTEGGRVRVTLSLVDVGGETPNTLGSDEVDDTSGSAFALQDAAVLALADLLRVEVGAETQAALAAGGTDDPEANELFLRGRGELRQQQGADDLARARALFTEALAIDSSFALAFAGLAEAEWQTYRATSDVAWADRAVASARRALALDDGLAEVHTVLGAIHDGRGEYGLALAAFDRALAIAPDHAEATRRLAMAYGMLGRSADAEATFRRAIDLAPDYWRPYSSFGVYYLDEGRADDATLQFQRGLALDPANTTLLINLGVAEWTRGDLEAAAAAFAQVARLDPRNLFAVSNLATVRATLGDYPGAVRAAETAVALQPDDYTARHQLAEARWWSPGQRAAARADYRATLDLARAHLAVGRTPAVLVTMAEAYAVLGQRDSARAALAEIAQASAPDDLDVSTAVTVGVAHEIAGQRAEAARWFRSALGRGFGRDVVDRSPWLADFRSSPAFSTLPAAP